MKACSHRRQDPAEEAQVEKSSGEEHADTEAASDAEQAEIEREAEKGPRRHADQPVAGE